MIHKTEFCIRTFHTDAFGHVNNARHLELLEEARWRFSEEIGLTPLLRRQQLGFIIIDARMRFRAPVSEGDIIRVHTSLNTLGTSSGEVHQTVMISESESSESIGSKALTSVFHFILLDRATAKSVPIENEIRELLIDVLETPSRKTS